MASRTASSDAVRSVDRVKCATHIYRPSATQLLMVPGTAECTTVPFDNKYGMYSVAWCVHLTNCLPPVSLCSPTVTMSIFVHSYMPCGDVPVNPRMFPPSANSVCRLLLVSPDGVDVLRVRVRRVGYLPLGCESVDWTVPLTGPYQQVGDITAGHNEDSADWYSSRAGQAVQHSVQDGLAGGTVVRFGVDVDLAMTVMTVAVARHG